MLPKVYERQSAAAGARKTLLLKFGRSYTQHVIVQEATLLLCVYIRETSTLRVSHILFQCKNKGIHQFFL